MSSLVVVHGDHVIDYLIHGRLQMTFLIRYEMQAYLVEIKSMFPQNNLQPEAFSGMIIKNDCKQKGSGARWSCDLCPIFLFTSCKE